MSAAKPSAAKSSTVQSSDVNPQPPVQQHASEGTAREHEVRAPFFADQTLIPLALEAGQIAVWSWDIRSKRAVWSSNIEAICGIAPESLSAAETVLENDVHPDDRPPWSQLCVRPYKRA